MPFKKQVEIVDHGMDESYLAALVDKLTDLYIETNEINVKRLKIRL